MKKYLLLLLFSLSATLLFSQAKKNIGGVDLYQKGSCERVSAKFVSCTYCTDKELKNCKEYWCTDDGTCTEAPLKNPNGQLSQNISGDGKNVTLGEKDTTSKLPKGTKFENGKVVVLNGYRAVRSSDKKMVFIISGNGPGVRGGFRCECESGSGNCLTNVINNKIVCGGDSCCRIVVTIYDSDELTMEKIEKEPEKIKWKKLIVATKSN